MFKIRKEQMEAMNRSWQQRRRHQQIQAFRDEGLEAEEDPLTQSVLLTDAAGGTVKITPTPKGLLLTTGQERVYDYEYGPNERIDAITDPAGLRISFDYDEENQLVAIHRGKGNTYCFEYDGLDHLSAIHFPDGKTRKFTHDNYGNLTSVTDRNQQETRYEYSDKELLIRQTDAKGNDTRFEYDGFNSASAIVFPNNDRHEFQYDDKGCLSKVSVNGAEHAFFRIDEEGGTFEINYTDGTKIHFLIKDGRIVEAINETCTVSLEYDDHGHLLSEDIDGQIVKYQRNEVGILTGITTPEGENIIFDRDKEYRVCGITDWSGNHYDIDYNLTGTLNSIKYPNGVMLSQEVTQIGLPHSFHVTSPLSQKIPIIANKYEYDLCDRVIKASENEQTKIYSYDDEGRLIGVHASDPMNSERFERDANGNCVKDGQGFCQYNAIDQLENQADRIFSYDGHGNMIAGHSPTSEAHFEYNGRNQLAAVTTSKSRTRYAYDAFGRRVRKEYDGLITRYVWAGQKLLSEITTDENQKTTRRDFLIFSEKFVPLAMRIDETVYYIHSGQKAEPLCMTDQDGNIVWQAEYSAFGQARITTEIVSQPWRFAGQYCDDETALHYTLARYYNPELGRYLTKDPMFVDGGSNNFYIYCDGDPINRLDPTGEFSVTTAEKAAGAATGAAVEELRHQIKEDDYDGWEIAKKAAIAGISAAVKAEGGLLAVARKFCKLVKWGAQKLIGSLSSIFQSCSCSQSNPLTLKDALTGCDPFCDMGLGKGKIPPIVKELFEAAKKMYGDELRERGWEFLDAEASHNGESDEEIPQDQISENEDEDKANLVITEIIFQNPNNSFTTIVGENEIQLTATIQPTSLADTNNPNVEWEIEDDPAVAGVTPDPDVSALRGNQVTITIGIPLVPEGRNYHKLNYRVRAKVNINKEEIFSEWRTFEQDEIDMLRQQYIDMGKDSVPNRDEFINTGSSTHFQLSEGACRCGHHNYHLWSIMNRLDNVRENLGHPMTVNSGYRCPLHNASASVGGVANSRHIYGDAADISVRDFNGDGLANQTDWRILRDAANSADTPSYIEPYNQTRTWVHMDWR